MRRLGRVVIAAVLMLVALWTGSVAQATEVVSCADGGVCVVGDTGPGGGKVFYVADSPFASPGSDCNTECAYLEAAPSDQSPGIIWATNAAVCYDEGSTSSTNDCQSNSIYSGDSAAQSASRTAARAIGMGMSNTNQIYARLTTAGSVATSSYGAGIAYAYTNNSKTDWFLPSKLELNELCKYARTQTTGTTSVACDSSGSLRSGFSAAFYGVSSESYPYLVWAQEFDTRALVGTIHKTGATIVRPVRAFSESGLLAPAFTLSSSSETKVQNVAITGYTISSTAGAITSYSISPSAPAGTSFNTSTGLLSGTPTTVQSATIYTITATNATSTAFRTFTLAVTLAAPAFTLSSSSETKAQNVAIAGYTISSTGGAIASYSISPSAPAGTSFNTSTGLLSGTPTTVQSATIYTITATNATSTASRTFTLTVTVTLAAPGAPLQPTVVVGNGRATVTVAAGTGGTPTSFRVSASPQVGGVTKGCGVNGASGSCIVGGLTNGQAYTFTATATNATGTSASSSASGSFVPLGVPAFTLSSISETKAQLVAITGYTISSTGGAIASYSISPSAPAGTSFSSVTGLLTGTPTAAQPPTRYTITATNASGSARAFFTLAVTAVAPGAPLRPTVVARNTRVDVSVVAGVGGLPTSFLVEASPQVAGVTKRCKQLANESFCIVQGLTNGVAYTFTATANNALGRSVASSASLSATPTARSCASGGPCAVGDTGRGGGIVFYVSASPFASPGSDCNTAGVGGISTCKYLEAAPSDHPSTVVWATNAAICYDSGSTSSTNDCEANSIYSGDSAAQDASRTASQAIGMGLSNTNQIYARLTTAGSVATTDYAAGIAWAYSNNSKTDWFLPSQLQLNELCKYARNQTTGTTSEFCNNSGSLRTGFSAQRYWSSTELLTSSTYARALHFSDGSFRTSRKTSTYYVRPVRAF